VAASAVRSGSTLAVSEVLDGSTNARQVGHPGERILPNIAPNPSHKIGQSRRITSEHWLITQHRNSIPNAGVVGRVCLRVACPCQ